MDCPICLRATTLDPCECGYDFATGDRSRAARRAEIVSRRATRKAWAGFGLLVSIPISVLAVMYLHIPLLATVMFFGVTFQLVAGVGWLVRGLSWRHAAQQRLERATGRAELPAARVIE